MKCLAVFESVMSAADRIEGSLLVGGVVCVAPSAIAASVLASDKVLVRRQLRLGAVLCLS